MTCSRIGCSVTADTRNLEVVLTGLVDDVNQCAMKVTEVLLRFNNRRRQDKVLRNAADCTQWYYKDGESVALFRCFFFRSQNN